MVYNAGGIRTSDNGVNGSVGVDVGLIGRGPVKLSAIGRSTLAGTGFANNLFIGFTQTGVVQPGLLNNINNAGEHAALRLITNGVNAGRFQLQWFDGDSNTPDAANVFSAAPATPFITDRDYRLDLTYDPTALTIMGQVTDLVELTSISLTQSLNDSLNIGAVQLDTTGSAGPARFESIEVMAVPEPSSVGTMGALVFAGWVRRRRSRRQSQR